MGSCYSACQTNSCAAGRSFSGFPLHKASASFQISHCTSCLRSSKSLSLAFEIPNSRWFLFSLSAMDAQNTPAVEEVEQIQEQQQVDQPPAQQVSTFLILSFVCLSICLSVCLFVCLFSNSHWSIRLFCK